MQLTDNLHMQIESMVFMMYYTECLNSNMAIPHLSSKTNTVITRGSFIEGYMCRNQAH